MSVLLRICKYFTNDLNCMLALLRNALVLGVPGRKTEHEQPEKGKIMFEEKIAQIRFREKNRPNSAQEGVPCENNKGFARR